jgi:hypothetical protein
VTRGAVASPARRASNGSVHPERSRTVPFIPSVVERFRSSRA